MHGCEGHASVDGGVVYTEAELEANIRALETALARGELRVDFADRSVTYRSTADLTSAIGYFKGLLGDLQAETNPGSRRSRQLLGVASRGL